MNTFLPYTSFDESAQSLDWRRLQKQITEGLQLCNLICRLSNYPVPDRYAQSAGRGWKSHPVLNLWRRPDGTYYLRELVTYIDACADTWSKNKHCRKRHVWYEIRDHYIQQDDREAQYLAWSDEFHNVMRANLMRKDAHFYGNQFGVISPREGYLWESPTTLGVVRNAQ